MSRLSSTNGNSRSSASMWPRVDLPAPRRPISAIREERVGASSLRGGPPPTRSMAARRTRRSVASSQAPSVSRSMSHSGVWVVTSPTSSASEHCSAWATCKSTRIEALPTPYSRLARCRSETPVARASALRVRPRRTRRPLARRPSAARNGSGPSPEAPVCPRAPAGSASASRLALSAAASRVAIVAAAGANGALFDNFRAPS